MDKRKLFLKYDEAIKLINDPNNILLWHGGGYNPQATIRLKNGEVYFLKYNTFIKIKHTVNFTRSKDGFTTIYTKSQ